MTNRTSRKSNRKVNVAVVGLGFMGVTHIKAYQQLKAAKIVAVCDSVRLPVNGVLAGVAGNVTGSGDLDLGRQVKVYRALDEVLADPEVELVDLCVPTPLHPAQAIAALKAGKHVLCEKPLALTSAQARKIVQAAQAASRLLHAGDVHAVLAGLVLPEAGGGEQPYGKVQAARFRRMSPMPGWSKATYASGNQSGGALFDLHIHDTDFVQFLFGRPASVFSTGVTRAGDSIDHVVTQYNYPRRTGGVCGRQLAADRELQHVLHRPVRTGDPGLRHGARRGSVAGDRGRQEAARRQARRGGRLQRGNPLHAGGDPERQGAEGRDRAGWT